MAGIRGMHWTLTKDAFKEEMRSRIVEKEVVDYNILSALEVLLDHYGVEETFVNDLLSDINEKVISTERIMKLASDYEEPIPNMMIENVLM